MELALLQYLFELSQWLMMPITVIMSVAFIWLVFVVGQVMRTAIDRWFASSHWRRYLDRVRKNEACISLWTDHARYQLHQWVATRVASTSDLPVLIKEVEIKAHSRLGRLQILIRTGPMLGLVGTLIPLGPALQGLAAGDIQELGRHMQIAFTMTVFGILIGALAYALYIVQRNWFENDLVELELLSAFSGQSPPNFANVKSREGFDNESQPTPLAS